MCYYIHIRRVSRTTERVVLRRTYTVYIYTFFPEVFQCSRPVVFSSPTYVHTYIHIYYTVGRPPTDYIDTALYIYNQQEQRRDVGILADVRFGVDFDSISFGARGNNSVSKKTVLCLVSEGVCGGGMGWGGVERVFSVHAACTHALLFSFITKTAAQKPFGSPPLNLLNGVRRDPIYHG